MDNWLYTEGRIIHGVVPGMDTIGRNMLKEEGEEVSEKE